MLVERRKGPGELIHIPPVPITWPLLSLVALLILIIAFWKGTPRLQGALNFGVVAAGVVGGLLGAYYVWAGLKANADLRQQALQQDRVAKSMELVRRWNDPMFGTTRKDYRVLLRRLEEQGAPDVREVLKDVEKRTVVADVLNFFEEVGYAAESGVADDDTLKAIFSGIVQRYYRLLYPWIAQEQAASHRPAYEYFERLRNRWVAGEKPTGQ